MRPGLNVRFLAWLVLGSMLLTGGVHLLHGYQVERNAVALLFQAERARDQGRLDLSAKYLQRYLGFQGDDAGAMASLALTLDDLAATRAGRLRALLAYEQALRHDSTRTDLRRRLVKLTMGVQRHADAVAHLRILQTALPEDGELHSLLGRCEEAHGNYAAAAEAFAKAVQHDPGRLEGYLHWAVLLRRRLNQPERADQVMQTMVQANDGFQPHLYRARYHRELGRLAEADQDIAVALQKAPLDAEVLLTAAEIALQRGDKERTGRLLKEGAAQHPRDWRMYQAAAELELAEGRADEAIARIKSGLVAAPNQPELLATLAELLVEQGRATEAGELVARLRKQRYHAGTVDYLEARVRMANEKWRQAVQLLERARPQLGVFPALQRQADLSLGRCLGQLGDADGQLAVCRRAVAADPNWLPGRLELAALMVASGKIEQALIEYRQIMSLPNAPAAGWVTLARLLMVQNQRLPRPQRDWREVERIAQALERAAPDSASPSVAAAMVRADLLAVQGDVEKGRQLLRQACAERPKELGPWLALVELTASDPAAAARLLDEAEAQVGDSVPLRLARLRHAVPKRGQPDRHALGDVLARLERDSASFSNDGQAQLFHALAEAHKRLGDAAAAERLWAEAAKRRPGDLRVRVSLFDLALQAGDETAMQRRLKEIQDIEGGAIAMGCEAAWLLARAAAANEKDSLTKARALVTQAVALRPGLPMLLLREAQLAELEGQPDRAIECYRQVVEKDDAQRQAILRLLHLLYDQRRYAEADQVIRRLQERSLADRDVQRLAAELSLLTQHPGRAVELARQAVGGQSKDWREHLWLGQILAAAGEKEDATRALRRAVELSQQAPEAAREPLVASVALVQHLVRNGELQEAEQVVARARTGLTTADDAVALAECHEALGRLDEAEKYYRTALSARPEDPALMRLGASFYVRAGRLQRAEELLGPLTQRPGADAAWARRSLALILAAKPDRRQVQRALELVEANRTSGADSRDDRRVEAHVFAALRDRPSRLKAIQLLEPLKAQGVTTADDLFLLAQLYEAERDWPRARPLLRELAAADDSVTLPAPAKGEGKNRVAHYVRSLIRRGELDEAQLWADRLEQGGAKDFAAIEIKARLLVARGRTDEAVELLHGFVQRQATTSEGEAEATRLAALLLDDLDRGDAERFYRRHVELQPQNVLALAAFLGRQGRSQEALNLCDQARRTLPVAAVGAAGVAVLRCGPCTPEQQQLVEGWLQQALQDDPDALAVRLSLADLRDLQGRWEEAESQYRRILKRTPDHVVALNNLAWSLAARDGKGGEALGEALGEGLGEAPAEAMELVNRAIALAGPVAELLDTRAHAALALGRTDLAIADLEAAVADRPTPNKQFHLARAYLLADKKQAARTAWQQAKTAGLRPDRLHALEQHRYQQVLGQLEHK